MRIYGKYPTIEYLQDNINAVPFICVCSENIPFKLATPYPMNQNNPCVIDPTRRINGVNYLSGKFSLLSRDQIEMHHFTFLRKDIKRKLTNVSTNQIMVIFQNL